MAEGDCGACDQIINCNAQFNKDDARNIALRLLCNIADNTASGSGGVDVEYYILCDVTAGVSTAFLRRIEPGPPPVVTDTELDGVTPYVTTGFVGVCDGVEGVTQIVPLCDQDTGAGSSLSFIRTFVIDQNGAITFTDTDLDGNPYVVTGEAGFCDNLLQRFQPSSHILCDVNAGVSTPFLRVYSINANDFVVYTVTDFTLAGLPYTPTGTVENCCCDSEAPANGVLVSSSESAAVVIAAGFWSVSITNVGGASGVVDGQPLLAGETFNLAGYLFQDGSDTYMVLTPAISIDGAGTILRVRTFV